MATNWASKWLVPFVVFVFLIATSSAAPPRTDIISENGAVAQALLQSNTDPTVQYDVIVVGSGMGGGVLASAFADSSKSVLVLEAGSLLFPTHVGNLARSLLIGRFDKHIWSLWYEFAIRDYNSTNGVYNGGQGFNLGGRSVFWGSSIPPLADWELASWPQDIETYLLDQSAKGGYEIARGVMNAQIPELHEFHKQVVADLSNTICQDWDIQPGPAGVQYSGATEWAIPDGIFSTADLLIEDKLSVGRNDTPNWREALTINLNHFALNIVFDPNESKRATGVRCFDTISQQERTYKANTVVIATGTLESARLALNSGIENDKIGKGVTDHPIWYRHFVISPDNLKALNVPTTPIPSTKLLIRH